MVLKYIEELGSLANYLYSKKEELLLVGVVGATTTLNIMALLNLSRHYGHSIYSALGHLGLGTATGVIATIAGYGLGNKIKKLFL